MSEQNVQNLKVLKKPEKKKIIFGLIGFVVLCVVFAVYYSLFANNNHVEIEFNQGNGLIIDSDSQIINFDVEMIVNEEKTEVDSLVFDYYLEKNDGTKLDLDTWLVVDDQGVVAQHCLVVNKNLDNIELEKDSSCTKTNIEFDNGRHKLFSLKIEAPDVISYFDRYKVVIEYNENNSSLKSYDSSGNEVGDEFDISSSFEIPIIVSSVQATENKLFLNPDSGTFEVGKVEEVSVSIDAIEDIVAVGADIVADGDYFEILSVDTVAGNAFPVEQNVDTGNSTYRLVMGAYGDGVSDNGGLDPTNSNPIGFKGASEELVKIKLRPLKETSAGVVANLKLENVNFVLDNGQGDQISPDIIDGAYEIIPEKPFASDTIVSQEVYCEENDTKLRLKVVASGYGNNLKVKINNNSNENLKSTKNVAATVKEYEAMYNIAEKEGVYSILKEDGTTFLVQDMPYNCLVEMSDVEIVDEVVTPFSTSAKVSFSTIGGPLYGKVNSSIEVLDENGNQAGDWDPKNINQSLFHDFVVYNLEPETRYSVILRAYAGANYSSVTDDKLKDEAVIYFNTRESLTERQGNTALVVTRDRTCDKWLSCNSSVKITNAQEEKETLCFDIGVCSLLDSNGRCLNPLGIGEEGFFGGNQNYMSPKLAYDQAIDLKEKVAELTENTFKNLSGYSKVGMNFGNQEDIEGYRHYADMPTIGNDVRVINGDLETGTLWPWDDNGLGIVNVSDDILSTDLNVSSNVLRIDTDLENYDQNGIFFAGAKNYLGYLSEGSDYVISFDAWTDNPDGESVVVQMMNETNKGNILYQDLFTENILSYKQRITKRINRKISDGDSTLLINKKNVKSNGSKMSTEEFSYPFYIDNVTMMPALAYQYNEGGENNIVSRSCRLFPTENALACDVLSGGRSKYYGWKGFCVEEDPRNGNMCLNWYPVDVIKGEVDAFGSEQQVGYTGRAPLYYCLESAGDAPYQSKKISGEKKSPKKKENWNPELPDLSYLHIHKDEIIEIRVDGVDMDDNGDAHSDCNIIAAEDYGCSDISSQPRSSSQNVGALIFDAQNKPFWEREFTDNCGNSEGTARGLNKYIVLRCSGQGKKGDNNMISGRLEFDDNEYLKKIYIHHHDGSPNEGAAKFMSINITYLGERCNVITQVVDPFGKNYAWTTRIVDNGWILNNPLSYEYDTDYYPYGALVALGPTSDNPEVDPNDPGTWQYALHVMPADKTSGLFAPYQSRAGMPYSIKSDAPQITVTEWKTCTGDESIKCQTDQDCVEGSEYPLYPGSCTDISGDYYCVVSGFGSSIDGDYDMDNCVYNDCLVSEGGEKVNADLNGANNITLDICQTNPSQCPLYINGDDYQSFYSNFSQLLKNSSGYYMGREHQYGDYGSCSVVHREEELPEEFEPIKSQCVMGTASKLGQECDRNSDCGYSDEGMFGLCIGADFSENKILELFGGYKTGIKNLQGLFAKNIKTWYWKESENKYVEGGDDQGMNWDVTKNHGQQPEIKNVFINSRADNGNGKMYYTNGLNTVLEFNTWIDLDQMPLTYYAVDWGDGHITEMNNLKIGSRPERDEPFIALHSYDKRSCENGCQIKITIQDNWDFRVTKVLDTIIQKENN